MLIIFCLKPAFVFVLWHFFYSVFVFSFRSSARIGTLLEQLQKLCLAGSEAKYEQDKVDVEQLRYVTNKIQQLLSSQGNYGNDCSSKSLHIAESTFQNVQTKT